MSNALQQEHKVPMKQTSKNDEVVDAYLHQYGKMASRRQKLSTPNESNEVLFDC